jgi:peptidyl-prolyl cis-trans isomerase SurA
MIVNCWVKRKASAFSYFLWVLLISFGFFSVRVLAAESVVVDRIVAVVNDQIITLYDLDQTLQPYEDNIRALGYSPEKERETLYKLRTDLLNKLIDEKLADQLILKNNIKVSSQEIDNAIERIKESRSFTDEDFRTGLAQQGLTMEEYRENLKQQLLRSKLLNLEVRSKIVITDEDIEKYYNDHREQYAGETKYDIWNIYIRFSQFAGAPEKQSALEEMEAILARLKQGQKFESLVSELPNSPKGPEGSDLGLFRLDELSPGLQKVVKDMKAGEYSQILDTDQGYQIIYIQNLIVTESKAISEVKSEIQEILYRESIDNRYNSWLSELRKRSHIKIIK